MLTERDWSKLPERFAYVRPAAEDYDRWLQRHRYHDRDALESLTDEQIASLARLYEEIEKRRDAEAISIWLEAYPADESRDDRGIYWPIMRLFSVFKHLGKRGIEPFRSRGVRFNTPDPPFDWSKLPLDLRYFGEFAEKFGGYPSDEPVDEFMEDHGDQGMNELAAASEQIRMRGDAPRIFEWLDKMDMVEHPEAAQIAWMLNLMEQAGVPIED